MYFSQVTAAPVLHMCNSKITIRNVFGQITHISSEILIHLTVQTHCFYNMQPLSPLDKEGR